MACRTSGIGAPMTEAAREDVRAHQPRTGGGVQPFHLESITAGGDCAVLRIDAEIDAHAASQIRDRVLDKSRWSAKGKTGSRTYHLGTHNTGSPRRCSPA
jgi:hypothetical protein